MLLSFLSIKKRVTVGHLKSQRTEDERERV